MARSSRLVYALAASVALNLVGAGYLVATSGRPHKPPRTLENTIEFVSMRYPEAMAAALRKRLEARRGELGTALDAMQEARRQTRETMAREPVDRAAIDAAFATARARAGEFQQVIHGAIAEAVQDVPAAERAKVTQGRD